LAIGSTLPLTRMNGYIILDVSTLVNLWRWLMSRVQLALNVADIDSAVEFYSKLFGTEPAKRQPGYANFAIADPPLKLVLMENSDTRGHGIEGALNHLGVEVETADEVTAASGRLRGEGLATDVQNQTTCCFAVQDKVWVEDPNGVPWEVYTVLADAPDTGIAGDGSCCVPAVDDQVAVMIGTSSSAPAACC
jgi:catechol 2,3-dioxygenase-like lactoylglutathione lyase family enzyme